MAIFKKSGTIEYHWDGQPCLSSERVFLKLTHTNEHLQIDIDAPFHDDPPPPNPPQSYWGLWEFEVVEIFLVGHDGQYLEAEFSPHGHHLLLWLNKPRNILKKHLPFSLMKVL